MPGFVALIAASSAGLVDVRCDIMIIAPVRKITGGTFAPPGAGYDHYSAGSLPPLVLTLLVPVLVPALPVSRPQVEEAHAGAASCLFAAK